MSRTLSCAPDEVVDIPQLTRGESRCLSEPPSSLPDNLRVESRPYDTTQEMRAMILTALPLPPLPAIVERLDADGRVCEESVQTSHDILSNLLIHACARNSPSENSVRKERQHEVLRSLIDRMCNRGQLQSIPDLYETYCLHTRLHMATYIPADGRMPPMRFAPLASVCRGDPTHLRMCDYMAGQAVILEEPNGRCAQDWLCREYADMLALARARLLSDAQPFQSEERDRARSLLINPNDSDGDDEQDLSCRQGESEAATHSAGAPPVPSADEAP